MSRYPRRRWELGWEEVRGLQHAKQSGLKTVDLQGREQPAAVSGGGAGLEGANEATRLSEQLRPGVHDVRRAVRFPQKCRFAQMQAKKKVNSWVHLGVDFLQVGEMKGRGNLI